MYRGAGSQPNRVIEEDNLPDWPSVTKTLSEKAIVPRKPLHYRFIKRAFDIVFSSCVIAVGFVPGLVLSAFIVADTKGSPIYLSTRITWDIIAPKPGADEKSFRERKFLSTYKDSLICEAMAA